MCLGILCQIFLLFSIGLWLLHFRDLHVKERLVPDVDVQVLRLGRLLLPMVHDDQIILAIVVPEEIVSGSLPLSLHATASTEAQEDDDEQGEAGEEQDGVALNFLIPNIRLLRLLTGVVRVLTVNSFFNVIWFAFIYVEEFQAL